MPHDIIMPALGMAQNTGILVAWHKRPGDPVAVGDALFEVETDKATMEVEAQGDGFLTDVRAVAGQEVPVGEVIARISETAGSSPEGGTREPPPAADGVPGEADLPKGETVIMPTLGMAQDNGLLVAWLKAPGDAVTADEPLFEVETDKSTVEVAAGHDGFLAATLAEAGETVPVGRTIAIISPEKPGSPVARSAAAAAQPETAAAPSAKTAPASPRPRPADEPVRQPVAGGRILASPKARRLALEQGLDLGRLVAAGHPQPYHARDVEALKRLPDVSAPQDQAAGAATAPMSRRLTAEITADGFAAFAAWAAKEAGVKDSDALLAGLAAGALGRGDVVISVQTFDRDRLFAADGRTAVGRRVEDGTADLVVRDLRHTRIRALDLGPEDRPVLTLTAGGTALAVTLECAARHMTAARAIALLSAFAGRMEQPLRHLL